LQLVADLTEPAARPGPGARHHRRRLEGSIWAKITQSGMSQESTSSD
jgi:hypothetical protein